MSELRSSQRMWLCPRCGRTRPGAGMDVSRPRCRYDLEEMRLAKVPVKFPTESVSRGPERARNPGGNGATAMSDAPKLGASRGKRSWKRRAPKQARKKN